MVHTLPDYTSKYKTSVIADVTDPGEAAVRLGSIDTFDRRGNVAFMEDFEGTTLKWTEVDTGAGGSLDIVNTMSLTGDQSLRVTAGSGANKTTGINRRFQQLRLKRLGFEASFTWNDNLDNFIMFAYIYTGKRYFYPFLDLDIAEGRLEVTNDDPGRTILNDAFDLRDGPKLFHTVKMVIDLDTGYWVSVIVDDREYDASAAKIVDFGDFVTLPHIWWTLYYNTTNAAVQTAYIDRLIMTQNES